MNENIEDNDWMNEAPTLSNMSRRNPFSTPEGYFNLLQENISLSIFLGDLKQKAKGNGFIVPQSYFTELTERIETSIALTEIKTPVGFGVPENYFDTLQARITNRIAETEVKKEVKVISLWRRNIVKYASAACFLLISSFGVYFYQNRESTVNTMQAAEFANEQMLYDIDEGIIIEHIEAQNTTSKKTTSASDTEMENYILNNFSSNDLAQEL